MTTKKKFVEMTKKEQHDFLSACAKKSAGMRGQEPWNKGFKKENAKAAKPARAGKKAAKLGKPAATKKPATKKEVSQ